MGETMKILCPEKKVLIPDMNAGCSLADSCKAEDLAAFKAQHPDHMVVSYVNTSAEVKALTDVVVTSSNAKKIVDQLPKDAKIIFGPDHNLGSYINSVTGREMLLWNGACHVHSRFSLEALLKLKAGRLEEDFVEGMICSGGCVGGPSRHRNEAEVAKAREGLIKQSDGRKVLENLKAGAYLRRDKDGVEKDVQWVYELFPRLAERSWQLAGTLSGGEQQMLAVGRGLMSRPKVLMMDEPSLGLAPLVVQGIFDIIREINRQGVTILLIEQNANMALKTADLAYVLETGRITMQGTGAELLANERVKEAYLGKKRN